MIFQRTIRDAVSISGVGVHSGQEATLTILPARPNQGISFKRKDLKRAPKVAANYKNIVNTQMATTLGQGKVSISTVEHVLAALNGLGIDNAALEVDGPEVPILDGSALGFYEAILKAGIDEQYRPKSYIVLRKRVEVKAGAKWAMVEPSSRFELHTSIHWDHPAIGHQEFSYSDGRTSLAELMSARTFGFLNEVEAMKRAGLAKGGSLDNAVVLDEFTVINPDGLRFQDEFVRHKALDAMGDLKLAGLPIRGRFFFHRAGHEIHRQLLADILSDSANFEIISTSEETRPIQIRVPIPQPGLGYAAY